MARVIIKLKKKNVQKNTRYEINRDVKSGVYTRAIRVHYNVYNNIQINTPSCHTFD